MNDTTALKNRLLEEKTQLEAELASIGRVNPDNPADWEAVPQEGETADINVQADQIEEYEGNTAVLKQLETRHNDVLSALKKIEEGTYGACEICGAPIEEERLNALPEARTCMAHMGDTEAPSV